MISTLEANEIPEHYVNIDHTEIMNTGGAVVTPECIAAGHHPKMRLVNAQITTMVHDTTQNKYTIEKGDGTDLTAQATASATALNSVDFAPVAGVVVERNESVKILSGSEGGANTVGMVNMVFESIH